MVATKAKAGEVAQALMPCVNAVLLARVHAECLREKINAVHADVLDMLDVHDTDGKRITDPKWSWRMADEYTTAYYAECDKRNAEMGYKLEPGYCPALIAESLQRDAEHLLVEASAEFFPGVTVNGLLCCSDGLGKLRKYLDLLIGLVVNAPGYKAPKL